MWWSAGQQETQLTEQLCPQGPEAAGSPGCPGPCPHGQQCSGSPAIAAAALRRGRSGTRIAWPTAASTHARSPASPQGPAHSVCSQGEGWCGAAGRPAAEEQMVSSASASRPRAHLSDRGLSQEATPRPLQHKAGAEPEGPGGCACTVFCQQEASWWGDLLVLPEGGYRGGDALPPSPDPPDSMASFGLSGPWGGEAGQASPYDRAATGAPRGQARAVWVPESHLTGSVAPGHPLCPLGPPFLAPWLALGSTQVPVGSVSCDWGAEGILCCWGN